MNYELNLKTGTNVETVLTNVELLLDYYTSHPGRTYRNMVKVCDYLNIFDWWKDTLTISDLKTMRTFLRKSIKYGFKGYCCFKVGAAHCSSGMWSYKKDTTTGYSPDGDFLYRSFQSNNNYWSVKLNNKMYPDGYEESYDTYTTSKELEYLFK